MGCGPSVPKEEEFPGTAPGSVSFAVDAEIPITQKQAAITSTTTAQVADAETDNGLHPQWSTLHDPLSTPTIQRRQDDKSDEGLAKAFEKVDADSSGKLSAAEMSAHIASVYGGAMDESITTEMLKAADTDGDGEVSLDEFKTIMRAGPDVKPKAAAKKPDNSQWSEPGDF